MVRSGPVAENDSRGHGLVKRKMGGPGPSSSRHVWSTRRVYLTGLTCGRLRPGTVAGQRLLSLPRRHGGEEVGSFEERSAGARLFFEADDSAHVKEVLDRFIGIDSGITRGSR